MVNSAVHCEQHRAGVTFVDADGDLEEGDLGAGDGEGEGGDREWMTQRIFSNDAQSCVIVFPSRSYSIAKERDQRQHCNFLHQWIVYSTKANSWRAITITMYQELQIPSWPKSYTPPPLRKHAPPPCASTAAVPKNQAKLRFNAHPMLRQDCACVWHT